jgi:hypothetical protein
VTPLPFAASYICPVLPKYAEAYARAVQQYGDPLLYIHEGELHDNDLHRDLTGFWEIFEREDG